MQGCFGLPEQAAQVAVRVPEGTRPGDIVETAAFGRRVRWQVLEGMRVGQYLELRCAEGAVTYAAAAAAVTTTAATLATSMVAAEMCRQSTVVGAPPECGGRTLGEA